LKQDWFEVETQGNMGRTPMDLLCQTASCEGKNKMLPLHHIMALSLEVIMYLIQLFSEALIHF
jgi:hypothetical protein